MRQCVPERLPQNEQVFEKNRNVGLQEQAKEKIANDARLYTGRLHTRSISTKAS